MTLDLARRLLATGAIAARDVEAALYLSVVRGVSIARALVDRGVLSERALEEELSRRAGFPLRQVSPAPDLLERLPRGMCRMLGAVPLRHDPASGVVEIAAVDPLDGHVAAEFQFHLGNPIRVQRATMSAIEEGIRRIELSDGTHSGRPRRRTPPFPHGAPDTVPPSPPPPSAPPTEEVPIPLVRRVASPSHPGARSSPGSLPNNQLEPLPLAPDEPPPSKRRLLRELGSETPSVSFPSAPPPALPVELRPSLDFSDAAPQLVESVPPSTEQLPAQFPDEPTEDEPVGEEEPTPLDADLHVVTGPEPEVIPRAPDAGWSPTLPELLDLMGRARGRDDLLDLMLRAVTLVAHRAALLVVRKDAFVGWSANPAFGSEEDLRALSIPTQKPSIFATSAVAGFYLGPIPHTPVHAGLLGIMGRATPDVAVYVAKVRGRPTIVLLADELDDTLLGTRALGEIAKRAAESLTRILAQKG